MEKKTKSILVITILAAAVSSLVAAISVLIVAEKNYVDWLTYLKGDKLTKEELKCARNNRLKEEVRPTFNRRYIRIDMNRDKEN